MRKESAIIAAKADVRHRTDWNTRYEREIDKCGDALQAMKARAEKAEAEIVEQRKAAEKLVLEFKAEVERLKAENAAIIYRPKMRGPIVDASATNPDDREPVEREDLHEA